MAQAAYENPVSNEEKKLLAFEIKYSCLPFLVEEKVKGIKYQGNREAARLNIIAKIETTEQSKKREQNRQTTTRTSLNSFSFPREKITPNLFEETRTFLHNNRCLELTSNYCIKFAFISLLSNTEVQLEVSTQPRNFSRL